METLLAIIMMMCSALMLGSTGANAADGMGKNVIKNESPKEGTNKEVIKKNQKIGGQNGIKKDFKTPLAKSFRRALVRLAGIELLHLIRKGQYRHPEK